MNLPSLNDLREQLEDALAAAITASAPSRLALDRVRKAAESVVLGHGLPGDVAEVLDPDRPVCTLLCFDADHIQRWVFDSERVQVVAGASRTLDHLNQQAKNAAAEIPGVTGTLYSAGGGGMLFAAATANRDQLVAAARRWLEERSRGLTFTVIAEELFVADLLAGSPPQEVCAGGFAGLDRFQVVTGIQGALVRAQIKMRAAKESNPRFRPEPPLRPRRGVRIERCPSCGHREPGKTPVTGNDPEFWCGWCLALRRWIRDQQDRPFERDGRPITFAELSDAIPRRRAYLGFIALDGNAMGSIFQGIKSFLQLRAFSEATSAIFEDARERAQKLLAGYVRKDWHPRDATLSLLSGGDEITLVMPAAVAPPAALAILRAVEEGFDVVTQAGGLLHQAFQGDPRLLERLRSAGSAAGVVTAHGNYPVRLLRRYASELQKQAKAACAEHGWRSAVAWRLLTDSSPLTRKLDAAPAEDMSLDALENVLAAARAAREVALPSSTLQRLLGHYRSEERSLASLGGVARQQVLDLLAANFFRYQLARNDRLVTWWRHLNKARQAGAEAGRDAVAEWFEQGGGRRLESLVDLLSLEPFPHP